MAGIIYEWHYKRVLDNLQVVNMRDYHRTYRPTTGQGMQGDVPRVIKTFRINLPDDWKEHRQVDANGWLVLPPDYHVEPKEGRLIVVKIKSGSCIRFRLLDKEGFNRLVERLNSEDFLAEEMGLRDKSEFFCAVDSVDYDSSGKVRLTQSQLITLKVVSKVELCVVKGDLEIGPPP